MRPHLARGWVTRRGTLEPSVSVTAAPSLSPPPSAGFTGTGPGPIQLELELRPPPNPTAAPSPAVWSRAASCWREGRGVQGFGAGRRGLAVGAYARLVPGVA
eukprot:2930001-Rhodomonas_salina.1